MSRTVLIVHEDGAVLGRVADRLTSAGYSTATASSFETARTLLTTAPPRFLITSLRLGAYNGLHLIVRGRLDDPMMRAVLITDTGNASLEAEVQQCGAAYLAGPVDIDRLATVVDQLLEPGEASSS